MIIRCPTCGELHLRHQVARPEYDPVAPQFAGGIVLGLVFVLSRKRRFRCEKCGELFYAHTFNSRFWQILWTLFWICLTVGLVSMLVNLERR